MGNSTSHPIFVALKELLNTRGIKLSQKSLQCFIESCEAAAPWFAVSGNLSVASWDKLGKDLDRAWEKKNLKPDMRPIWRLVRACLEDKNCEEAKKLGNKALQEHRESQSERESETNRSKRKGKHKGKETSPFRLYPSLEIFSSDDRSEQDSLGGFRVQ